MSLPASGGGPRPPAPLPTATCGRSATIDADPVLTANIVRPSWCCAGTAPARASLSASLSVVDGSQGNLAIAQGRQPELDFEQDRLRDDCAFAADLKEADLAHHAERLSVQRLQHSPLFLGQQASENKTHCFSQLFPVRTDRPLPSQCRICASIRAASVVGSFAMLTTPPLMGPYAFLAAKRLPVEHLAHLVLMIVFANVAATQYRRASYVPC